MRRFILIALLLVLLIGALVGYKLYASIFSQNVQIENEKALVYIPSDSDFDTLLDTLVDRKIISDTSSFRLVSRLMKFDRIRSGKYTIQNGWSNKELISVLRSGNQTPVRLTYNNVRTVEDLAGAISHQIEADSLSILQWFTDQETLEKTGLTPETILTLFIPNTYEVFWNIKPDKLLKRLIKEHSDFWDEKRKSSAADLNMTPAEIYTLASIVQKETNYKTEKPTIAGVYLNRLKRGILLQADPTVVFATGQFDLRRVLNKHIELDSPYNTYMYEGLPPGPIYMPDISSIDAVLSPQNHNYLYFCASIDEPGKHKFAKTLIEHNKNADQYRQWLNKQRIYR